MSWSIIGGGLALFAIVTLLHILCWKIFRPHDGLFAPLLFFIFIPLVTFLPLLVMANLSTVALLYLALAIAYVQTYPVFHIVIPSFRILRLIHTARHAGITEEEIIAHFQNEPITQERLDLLVHDKLIQQHASGAITLSPAGKIIALIFYIYRTKIYGLEIGKG